MVEFNIFSCFQHLLLLAAKLHIECEQARAFSLLEIAAALGSVEAIGKASHMLLAGEGIQRDEKRGFAVELHILLLLNMFRSFHSKLLFQHSLSAVFTILKLFIMFIFIYNSSRIFLLQLAQRGVDAGDALSFSNLGFCFRVAYVVKQDEKRAVELYKRSIELGSSYGMNNLADCYRCGSGVPKDEVRLQFSVINFQFSVFHFSFFTFQFSFQFSVFQFPVFSFSVVSPYSSIRLDFFL